VPVEKQVAVIYAVTNGHLDAVPVDRVRVWEQGFLDFLDAQYGDLLEGFRTEKALTDALEERLKAALVDFNAHFEAQEGAASA
jgi:F-type H+/Na+-transporting ATPase subunit alpha